MSTLSLDFSDASFDQDDIYRIGGDGFVYEMKDAPTGQPQAIQPAEGGKYTDQNGNPISNGGTLGAISAAALTLPPGAVFDFEFIDTDGYGEDDPSDTRQDQYKLSMTDKATGSPVQEFYIGEQHFDGALELTNQGSMAFEITSTMEPQGARSILLTTPISVEDKGAPGTMHEAVELIASVVSNNPPVYTFSAKTAGSNAAVEVETNSAMQAFNTATGSSVSSVAEMVDAIWSETRTEIMGDLGGTAAVNWVVSGDINGRDATSTDDYIGFRPGYYDGVFKGGDGFDTLVFEHFDTGPGQPAAQTIVALDLGMAYMHGTFTPIIKFAEHKAGYEVDWERLEIRGDSDDTVTVNLGLNTEDAAKFGAGVTGEAQNIDASVDANGNLVGYFQMELGSGDDRVEIYESDNLIELDLSSTADQSVSLSTVTGASGSDEFSLSSSGYELGPDGRTELSIGGSPAPTGDSSTLSVRGTDIVDATIDYISFGQGTNNAVDNNSDQGIIVNFGSADDRYGSGDSFTGKDANNGPSIGADIIDLRNETSISITDTAQTPGSVIEITASGGVDISATNVDMLLVSDGSGDEDYLVNKEYLYGSNKGVGGHYTITDINGDGFDVITSARLDDFNDASYQIFYDGDHTDFDDTRDDDNLTIDLAANTVTVGTATDAAAISEQKNWETQVENSGSALVNPNGNTPTFYIEVNANKVAVHFDAIDQKWKVDTSAFEISSNSSINDNLGKAAQAITNIEDNYGIDVSASLSGITSGDVYLNATETDISNLLGNKATAAPAHNFTYYTQVVGKEIVSEDDNGNKTYGNDVQVNVALEGAAGNWSISDNDVLVETSYNTETFGAGETAVAGSSVTDFIEMGANANGGVAMGNGGDDVYQVDDNTDGGLVYEVGGIMDNSGALVGSDEDTVQFELAEEMYDLDLSRGQIAGERADSTLFIDGTASGSGKATLFDQYNDFAFFRQTEFLMIDDGATANEIFEIADGTDITAWQNEVYVAKSTGGVINVVAGGQDHVFLDDTSGAADNVVVGTVNADHHVVIHNFETGDKVNGAVVSEASSGAGSDMLMVTGDGSTNTYTLLSSSEWDVLTGV